MLDATATKATAAPQRTAPARSRRRRFGANVPSSVISIGSLTFILGIWELFGRQINPLFAEWQTKYGPAYAAQQQAAQSQSDQDAQAARSYNPYKQNVVK